jgi:NAD(P)-dependent dehydrogenase (short-subunit alcohol dehydrogenase family)
MLDLNGKVVLVTGGTCGIGRAAGLAYGREGARVVLTHRWGTADERALRAEYAEAGAPEPLVVEADVSRDEDTEALLEEVADEHDHVDVLVSNVAWALLTPGLDDWSWRGLTQSIRYTAWPMWAYTRAIHERFGHYPHSVIGLSSDGPDGFFMNYDFVGQSKAVLETMCRYMNFRLRDEGVRVNIVRSRLVRTASFAETFGPEIEQLFDALGGFDDCATSPEEIANVILALGSGLLSAVGGQILMVDKGFSFFDNLMGIAERAKTRRPELVGLKNDDGR